ncbi:MAG TPA: tetratricopeptide repeat protein [Gammaproteobacteria bacterium]|nr:tetratricopeptide repeat protein [Gammaproteobacteria bacterium]
MKQVFDEDTNYQQEWIADNWKSILVSVLISLCIVGVLQWYQQQQLAKSHEASLRYFTFINTQHDPNLKSNNHDLAISIITDFPKSPYSNLARLFLAQDSQQNKQERQALLYYQQILDYSSDEHLKDIVLWRMANIHYHQSSYDAAIQDVIKIQSKAIQMAASTIQAKALTKLNRKQEALDVINQQLQANPSVNQALTESLKGQLEMVQSELNSSKQQLTSSLH